MKREESPDPGELIGKFKFETLPKLQLEGKTARGAIESLNQLEFYCTLVGEKKNIITPSKPTHPFVKCTRLLSNNGRVYGLIWVLIDLINWKGDGTLLGVRYEQLAESRVHNVDALGISYGDSRDSPASRQAARQLDQTLVILNPGQTIGEVAKYTMTHDISCRTTVFEVDHRTALDCSVTKPSPQCRHGLVSIDVAEAKDAAAPLTLWSTDRQTIGKQKPWICIN